MASKQHNTTRQETAEWNMSCRFLCSVVRHPDRHNTNLHTPYNSSVAPLITVHILFLTLLSFLVDCFKKKKKKEKTGQKRLVTSSLYWFDCVCLTPLNSKTGRTEQVWSPPRTHPSYTPRLGCGGLLIHSHNIKSLKQEWLRTVGPLFADQKSSQASVSSK